jgi:hypothetical protein
MTKKFCQLHSAVCSKDGSGFGKTLICCQQQSAGRSLQPSLLFEAEFVFILKVKEKEVKGIKV